MLALVLTILLGLAACLGEGVWSGLAWAGDELFVANTGANAITVYGRTASGNVAPLRTLIGGATGLNQPISVVADTVNNELVVGNWGNNSITVYSLAATGNTAPIRTLAGAATGLTWQIQ
jgi:hypothetical protein